ncbi:MAG: flagellar brake protein [Chloroflexi bacterium]|nr:flagellar brake protein [Chloroflexota bacterium]
MLTTQRGLGQTFAPGLTIALEFEEESLTQHVLSQVTEAGGGRLWVTMPMRRAAYVPLPVDTLVMLHVKREEGAFALRARVIGCRWQPAPVLELASLGEIVRRPPREYVRLRVRLIPARVVVLDDDGGETRLAATIVNLSAGGVLLRSRQALRPGQQVALTIELPPARGVIHATTRVLRVDLRQAERGVYYDAGCSFIALTEADRDLITGFIFRSQVRQRQESAALS